MLAGATNDLTVNRGLSQLLQTATKVIQVAERAMKVERQTDALLERLRLEPL